MDRRTFLNAGGIAAVSAAVVGSHLIGTAAAQQATPAGGAKAYAPMPLPLDPKAVTGFSERLLSSHHANNYTGTVTRLNGIEAQLAALDFETAPGFTVNGLKREQLIAGNSMILHELYFAGFGAGGG